jgi:AcrR family transcriptional regulator
MDPGATTAILDAALRLVAERGYRATTTEQVAAAARASKATVYRRWPTKPALVADAVQHALRLANPVVPATGDVRRDLVAVLTNLTTALFETPLGGAVRALISEASTEPALAAALAAVDAAAREHGPLRPLVERAQAEGLAPPGENADFLADLLLAGPYFHLLVRGGPPPDNLAERTIAHVLYDRTARPLNVTAGARSGRQDERPQARRGRRTR